MNKNSTNKNSFKPLYFERVRWILAFVFISSLTFSANAQTTLKERLEKHVYTLTSD